MLTVTTYSPSIFGDIHSRRIVDQSLENCKKMTRFYVSQLASLHCCRIPLYYGRIRHEIAFLQDKQADRQTGRQTDRQTDIRPSVRPSVSMVSVRPSSYPLHPPIHSFVHSSLTFSVGQERG